MPETLNINVYPKNELCVYGKDLRRLRYNSQLARHTVCERMTLLGFAYYPVKLFRYEKQTKLCLPEHEMISLIDALDANFIIK